ncbi:hematological and neurological expressed 1 [Oncorhynchus mykiss]|uniref:Hematological and neurological expressed 1 protein n=1 Tax=Oncorhynchus mykiss TaxID=8022 RepID=C1BEH1_ONCMY|nr:hematological and neurological expressed 1 [Oncorhynchus mykiss]ACO07424.1 Hematological and neurological expressed 1 protein [Oncorhynchus mykiss]
MTTTTIYSGMEAGAKSSSRVLRPPGGASNISFGNDEEKPPNRKNKMASNIFAEPDDPHAHRRSNPPGGKPTGVLCGEPSAPLRRCAAQSSSNNHEDSNAGTGDNDVGNADNAVEVEVIPAPEQRNEASQPATAASQPAAGMTSGRRNPPGGKSSLILG